MVVASHIDASWLEEVGCLLEAQRINLGIVLKDALIRVCEAEDRCHTSERRDDAPLIIVGVLELVEDDHGVFSPQQRGDRRARRYDVRDSDGELVEREDTFIGRTALKFRRPIAIELGALDTLLVWIGDTRR